MYTITPAVTSFDSYECTVYADVHDDPRSAGHVEHCDHIVTVDRQSLTQFTVYGENLVYVEIAVNFT